MKLSLLRRNSLWFGILGVMLVSAFILFAHGPTAAHADSKTLEGTWNVQIQFTSGPLAGQTKQGTITYAADGTLTSQTTDGVSGTGTWNMTSKLGFHYELDEQVYRNGQNIGYIAVVQDGSLSKNAKTNSAQGSGTFYVYTPNGPQPVAVNDTQTTEQRTSKS